jgi:CRP/FNR family transcriptional regulator, cyclic AMP receptor protein
LLDPNRSSVLIVITELPFCGTYGFQTSAQRPMQSSPSLPDGIRPFLTQSTILGRLPGVVLDALVRKGQLKSYDKGALIYRRGDPGDSLMVVIAGRVKLANTNVGGKEVALDFLGSGDILGETSALDGKERAVDAVALERSDIFAVYTRDLLPILLEHPQALLEIIRVLCERTRAGAAIIEDNSLRMRARAARGLLRLARRRGSRSTDGDTLVLAISQEELGKHLGLTRENVNRQLGKLKLANLIRVDGTEISIIDEKGLDELGTDPSSTD